MVCNIFSERASCGKSCDCPCPGCSGLSFGGFVVSCGDWAQFTAWLAHSWQHYTEQQLRDLWHEFSAWRVAPIWY